MAKSNKRVALITGGSRGIGLGIAEQLAASGLNVAINGRRDATDVADAVAAIENLGAEVLYCQGDVADAVKREGMLSAVRDKFGRLDVLVNNAGVAPKERADILEATEESFDRLIAINLKGPYFLSQLAARWMIEQRAADAAFLGAIINISSVSATEASINRGDYCISKAGIAMATQLWAMRLAEHDICVYEVRPGLIRTDMSAPVAEAYEQRLKDGLAVQRRWGESEDVGRTVAALARGDLTYATGNVLMVDGGMTIRRL